MAASAVPAPPRSLPPPQRAGLLCVLALAATLAAPALAQPAPPTAEAVEQAEAPRVGLLAPTSPLGFRDAPAPLPSVPGVLRRRAGAEETPPDTTVAEALRDSTDRVRERPAAVSVFGYYRLFLYGRNITEPYPNLEPFERAYGVGDGYREPMLSVNVVGRPSGRASFGTELFLFSPYDGLGVESNTFSINLGVNFYGNFRTEVGNFGVRAGGIHWYNLSPFTIGVYQVLDRFSIFDRTPWEGVTGVQKYEGYFQTGQANPGDERFNFQAFQGLILDGRGLPGGFGFDAFWGKTQPNGGLPGALTELGETGPGDTPTYIGLSGEARALPSFITGGRIQREFGELFDGTFERGLLALNSITSYRTVDSLSGDRRSYQVHTAQVEADVAGVTLSGEFGASRYDSPTYTSPWGEALMARVQTEADLTRVPLELQVYQVGRHFFNENGEIATNNNPELRADPRCAVPAGGGSSGGLITQVGQLAHNRRGVNFNTALEAGPARLAVGWGVAHELAPTTSELSYIHRINGLALSRVYNPFPAEAVCATQFGPFGRQYSFFRGVFERVPLTDVEPVTGVPLNRKYFHAVDIQAKLGARVLDRAAYLFYLGSFGSANPSLQAVPRDDDTYLFVQYHELDAYLELFDGFLLAGYLGIENARGGRFTELSDVTGRPRDQLATGFGIGFDWSIARSTGLYFRHRWMDFEDRSFPIDTYAGHETTLELKVFF